MASLSGMWQPNATDKMYYGSGTVEKHLLSCLPNKSSKAFIITGSSLGKTDLVKQIEQLLGSQYAGTFAGIGQHAPEEDLDKALAKMKDASVDTVISLGGGSPIDSSKAISYRKNESDGKFLYHIAIPTTLSAAECTQIAGYTAKGQKTSYRDPHLVPDVVLYDSKFALKTPARLWLSTGFRALDHAVEAMYHPAATEVPARVMALTSIASLFENLPRYKEKPEDEEVITRLQLAAYGSLFFWGQHFPGGFGLSHAMGYALGAPYGIPHGITSCMTLGHVVKLKAEDKDNAAQLARILPVIGASRTDDVVADANRVGDEILALVDKVGLKSTLKDYDVGGDQVDVITKAAVGKNAELYDKVKKIVEGLY